MAAYTKVAGAIDYTQEMRLIEWLSAQIAQVKQQHLDELDDEETLLLLL